MARALHRQANVLVKWCGIEEVKRFQEVMEDVQVLSKEHFNIIIYEGPDSENKIYLYYHDEHQHACLSKP